MSVAAPLWFLKFWKKILDFGICFRNFEFVKNFENLSDNSQSMKQILTLRGVYKEKTLQRDVVFGRGRLTSPSLRHVLQRDVSHVGLQVYHPHPTFVWKCPTLLLLLG